MQVQKDVCMNIDFQVVHSKSCKMGGKLALIANCGIPNNRPIKIEKNRFVNEKRNGVTA